MKKESTIEGYTLSYWENYGKRRVYIRGNGIKESAKFFFDLDTNDFAPHPRMLPIAPPRELIDQFMAAPVTSSHPKSDQGSYPVSKSEINAEDPETRMSIKSEIRESRKSICPDCGRVMEHDEGGYYCEYCEG